MVTTKLGNEIIKSAETVLALEYRAGNRNQYGDKLEQVVKEYDAYGGTSYFAGTGKKQPDYCGITASVILDRAFKNYGTQNTFRSASAAEFLNLAKNKGLRVDKKPQAGCLFFTKRSGGSGYHVGLVWDVVDDGVKTIEGNTYSSSSFHVKPNGCKTKLGAEEYGILSRMRPINKIDYFVHVEEYFDKIASNYEPSQTMLADNSNMCSMEDYDMNPEKEGYPSSNKSKYLTIGGYVLGIGLFSYLIYTLHKA